MAHSPRTGQSIYWHLFAFALGLATPILVIVALVGWRYVEQEQRKFEEQAQRLVQDVAAAIDADLAGFRATLDILATFPQLISGDLKQFYEHLKSATLAGGDGWIVVRRPDGQVLLNSRVAYGAELPRYNIAEVDNAVFTDRKSIVSDVLRGPTTDRWVVTLATPVVNERNDVPYAVQLILPAEYFESVLRQQQSPSRWVLTINDREGRILARSLNHTEWVGKPMAPQGWAITKDVPRGQGGIWSDLKTLEGRAVEGAYYRMISTGWLVGSAAPSEAIMRLAAKRCLAIRVAFFLCLLARLRLCSTVYVVSPERLGEAEDPDAFVQRRGRRRLARTARDTQMRNRLARRAAASPMSTRRAARRSERSAQPGGRVVGDSSGSPFARAGGRRRSRLRALWILASSRSACLSCPFLAGVLA